MAQLAIIKQMISMCRVAEVAIIRQMGRQVSRSSAGEYQVEEQAGIARLSWRISSR